MVMMVMTNALCLVCQRLGLASVASCNVVSLVGGSYDHVSFVVVMVIMNCSGSGGGGGGCGGGGGGVDSDTSLVGGCSNSDDTIFRSL